jgi:hypothetical protein
MEKRLPVKTRARMRGSFCWPPKTNTDWLVTLRDMGQDRAENCEVRGGLNQNERVVVALHRGNGEAVLDVPTNETWADGCKVSQPLLGEGRVSASAEGIHLSLNGNDVLIAACE